MPQTPSIWGVEGSTRQSSRQAAPGTLKITARQAKTSIPFRRFADDYNYVERYTTPA
jgi:hypothetical protein